MLITKPDLTMKHEKLVPIRPIRGIKKSGLGLPRQKSASLLKQPKMCECGLVYLSKWALHSLARFRCQRLASPCTHPQTGLNTNRRHVVTPTNQEPRTRYRAEPAATVQLSPTAVAAIPNHQQDLAPTANKAVLLSFYRRPVWAEPQTDFSQSQFAYWHIAARDLQPSILAVILSWPNKTQLPINKSLANDAIFGMLDEHQKAPSAGTPSRNTKRPQRQRQLSPLCSARHEEESASIELLNRVSIADGKRWDLR